MSRVEQSEEDVVLALALATGSTCVAAAEQAKISERTVRRRLDEPAFRSLVAELRAQLMSQALGRMTENLTRAADALVAMLDTPDESIRLRAARNLINLGIRLRDSVDLTSRMREVEVELARRTGTAF